MSVTWPFYAIILLCILSILSLEKQPDDSGEVRNESDKVLSMNINGRTVTVQPGWLVRWKDKRLTYEEVKDKSDVDAIMSQDAH